MIKVGIIGATGYVGEELIDILLRHSESKLTSLSAKIDIPQDISVIFPRFKNRISLVCGLPDVKETVAKCELVFLALPHTCSLDFVPALLKAGKKVIDLSADYRLKDTQVYEQFYQAKQIDSTNLKKAIYGLPELNRQKIKGASLVANPGCYPTAAILGLAPLVALGHVDLSSVIIDAKSGVTGAGRKATQDFSFSEINEDFRAYKVNSHQHAPEIDQELSQLAGKKIETTFVPHLLPLNRGILETIYVKKSKKAEGKSQKLIDLYKKFYKREPFVRILEAGAFPQIKNVAHTNFCDIGIKEEADKAIVIVVIDNLLKGASGQAVQNMNIMCGLAEQTALL